MELNADDYKAGDVVEGRFSCLIDESNARGIIRRFLRDEELGRVFFDADRIDYSPCHGYGLWGYTDEIESVRPGTQADEEAAAEVRQCVSDATDRILGRRV